MYGKKKVDVFHGMGDDRWTTKDKITQYRGLIKFFAREQQQRLLQNGILKKKQTKQIRELRKDIDYFRDKLYDTVFGDKQRLRNALQHHRSLMLAFQGLLPPKVVENIKQHNSSKRKELDRLRFKKKQKMTALLNLKLEEANVKENLELVNSPSFRYSEQVLINQIQNVNLRFTTCKNINNAYRTIIDLLKQDSLYFDAVLAALRSDSIVQSNCIIQATKMGQEATEHLATLQDDYKVLEKQIKLNMKERDRAVKSLKIEVQKLYEDCLGLVRIESDTEVDDKPLPIFSFIDLTKEMETLKSILIEVQATTHVSTFDDIFPRIKDQLYQKNRLLQQLESNTELRDSLLNKRNHAQMRVAQLESSVVETTFIYKEEKANLLKQIATTEVEAIKMNNEIEERGDLAISLRSSLQTLLEMVSGVLNKAEAQEAAMSERRSSKSLPLPPVLMSEDAQSILGRVIEKLQLLIESAPEVEPQTLEKATMLFQRNAIELVSRNEFADVETYDIPLVDMEETEDANVPTRMDVKNTSKDIVTQHENPAEFEMQMALPAFARGGAGDTKKLKNK